VYARTPIVAGLTLLLGAGAALGQTRDPEPAAYSFVSGTGHGAALWVNPGAAGFNRAVYLLGHMTWDRPEGGEWLTGQYTVGFHSRIIAFGYRHDEFQPGGQGDAYTASLGVARGRNGIGVSRTGRRRFGTPFATSGCSPASPTGRPPHRSRSLPRATTDWTAAASTAFASAVRS
jgi:hypothetical protein